jgi:cytochrome c oxidase subunit 4
MAIALSKATLVVLFFMHVKGSARMTGVVIAAALLFLAVLFGLTLSDYLSRDWLGPPGR